MKPKLKKKVQGEITNPECYSRVGVVDRLTTETVATEPTSQTKLHTTVSSTTLFLQENEQHQQLLTVFNVKQIN